MSLDQALNMRAVIVISPLIKLIWCVWSDSGWVLERTSNFRALLVDVHGHESLSLRRGTTSAWTTDRNCVHRHWYGRSDHLIYVFVWLAAWTWTCSLPSHLNLFDTFYDLISSVCSWRTCHNSCIHCCDFVFNHLAIEFGSADLPDSRLFLLDELKRLDQACLVLHFLRSCI